MSCWRYQIRDFLTTRSTYSPPFFDKVEKITSARLLGDRSPERIVEHGCVCAKCGLIVIEPYAHITPITDPLCDQVFCRACMQDESTCPFCNKVRHPLHKSSLFPSYVVHSEEWQRVPIPGRHDLHHDTHEDSVQVFAPGLLGFRFPGRHLFPRADVRVPRCPMHPLRCRRPQVNYAAAPKDVSRGRGVVCRMRHQDQARRNSGARAVARPRFGKAFFV